MTTIARLRPMSIGDMFDTAFKLYRRHFLTFIGVVALLQVPMAIVQYILQYVVGRQATLDVLSFSARSSIFRPGATPLPVSAFPINSFLTFYAITIGIAVLQGLFVQSMLTGALANVIARSYLGRSVSILDAYRLGWRRYAALILAALVLFVIGTVVVAIFVGCAIGGAIAFAATLRGARLATASGLLGALAVLGAFVLVIPLVLFFFIRFILTTQAIVLEGRDALSGLGRSWQLIGTSFWRALVVFILVLVLSLLISAVPAYMVMFLMSLLGAGSGGAAMIVREQAVSTLISQLGLIIAYPLLFSIYTLFYYDLRVRKEGYDLELMAQQAAAV